MSSPCTLSGSVKSRRGLKLKSRSILEKMKVIEKYESGVSIKDIGDELSIKRTTAQDIIKNREKIKAFIANKHYVPSRKKMKYFENEELDQMLYKWFSNEKMNNRKVSGMQLHKIAKELAVDMAIGNFIPNGNWMWRFRKRHNLVFDKNHKSLLQIDDSESNNPKSNKELNLDMIQDEIENESLSEDLDLSLESDEDDQDLKELLKSRHEKTPTENLEHDQRTDGVECVNDNGRSNTTPCSCRGHILNLSNDVTLLKHEVIKISRRQKLIHKQFLSKLQSFEKFMVEFVRDQQNAMVSQNRDRSENISFDYAPESGTGNFSSNFTSFQSNEEVSTSDGSFKNEILIEVSVGPL